MAQYKKPSKKVEEAYLKNKEKEIPLYDPQTGEANLEYEKITGRDIIEADKEFYDYNENEVTIETCLCQ